MTIFDAVLLGIIQGLTEFLPISSSGHLVISQALLGVKESGVAFEILVHLGSLCAVLIFFRASIIRIIVGLFKNEKQAKLMTLYLIIGTIPTVLIVLLIKDYVDEAFAMPALAAVMLLVTGLILLSTKFIEKKKKPVSGKNAFLIGFGQALAILPGISRSGTTISVGMLLGVDPSLAAEFSFLLAIPAILGAVVFKFKEIAAVDNGLWAQYFAGFIASFVFSLLAVYLVLALIRKGKFEYFAYYCFAAGLFGLYLFL